MKLKIYDVLTSQEGIKHLKKTSQVQSVDKSTALKKAKIDNPGALFIKVKLNRE
jgi:hypothetical protein